MILIVRKISPYVLTALLVAASIYLTPLKWVNVIEPTIKDIEPVVFYNEFQKNPDTFLFIDVRSEEVYNNIHAKGSVNIPLHMLYDERKVLPRNGKTIVLICSRNRAAGVAYSYLQHYGFTNIRRVEGGIEKWIASGLPTETSLQTGLKNNEEVLSLETLACVG